MKEKRLTRDSIEKECVLKGDFVKSNWGKNENITFCTNDSDSDFAVIDIKLINDDRWYTVQFYFKDYVHVSEVVFIDNKDDYNKFNN